MVRPAGAATLATLLVACWIAAHGRPLKSPALIELVRGTDRVDGLPNPGLNSELSTADFSLRRGRNADFYGSRAASSGTDAAYAGILVTLSDDGISYARQVVVDSVLKDLTPLKLPDVSTIVEWPIGTVHVELTNLVINYVNVTKSDIAFNTGGVRVFASGVQTQVSLDWKYKYTASLMPFPVSDSGHATAKVHDGEAWINATLKQDNGTLTTQVQECKTDLHSLVLELSGGQSWLYQWFVYAFQGQIRSAVESALTTRVLYEADELNNVLLHLPRRVPVDNTSALDVTVVDDPILNSDFLSVGLKGEFVDVHSTDQQKLPLEKLPAGILCKNSDARMATIALSHYVIDTASEVYFRADRLERMVDKLPQQSFLNTASWKFLIPQLYRKYPNEDMVLNISATSPPKVTLSTGGIRATTTADMTINVLDQDQTVSVACISLEISVHAVAKMVGSNVTAEASLLDLQLQLKWSSIGTFPVKLVQAATRTVVKDVILPLVNLNLRKGFPLPLIPAMELQNPSISYEDDFLLVCTDVRYTGLPTNWW